MTIPGGAAHRTVTQVADRISFGIKLFGRSRRAGRVKQIPIFGCKQEDQPIDQAKELAEEIWQR